MTGNRNPEIVVSIPTKLLKLTPEEKARLEELFKPTFASALNPGGETEDETEVSVTVINN